jgi:arsenical pump membrane protein
VTAYRAVAAGAIFLLTMATVITRPRRVDESVAAALGALAMLGLGVVSPGEALGQIAAYWNLFLFFLGLMLISGLADAAGFFDAAGALAAGAARGSGRLLLLGVFVVGTVTTTFLSNDATALILTPVVCSVATRLRLPPLPYLFATTFVADTASMTLPVSNPINILVGDSSSEIGSGARTRTEPQRRCRPGRLTSARPADRHRPDLHRRSSTPVMARSSRTSPSLPRK